MTDTYLTPLCNRKDTTILLNVGRKQFHPTVHSRRCGGQSPKRANSLTKDMF